MVASDTGCAVQYTDQQVSVDCDKPDGSDPAFEWLWTREGYIQSAANSSSCLTVVGQNVQTGICSQSGPWTFRTTQQNDTTPTSANPPPIKDEDGDAHIYAVGRSDLCLSALPADADQIVPGMPVGVAYCKNSTASNKAITQRFDMQLNSNRPGPVKFDTGESTDICLDAGDNPSIGSLVLTYPCTGGKAQQFSLEGTFLFLLDSPYCLTLTGTGNLPVTGNDTSAQLLAVMDTCRDPDPQQLLTLTSTMTAASSPTAAPTRLR
ncbi:hypothetical protein M231_03217 [Tremella mesenterica]|uniref:Ricin B lectin domain-containing protein n=1 Tax=Tremella mesenterica TaxID=5217 RepID=A0A4Q1BNV6_TREME|nr:hypothetical protein M231_03217 [Tremella mesenterica]